MKRTPLNRKGKQKISVFKRKAWEVFSKFIRNRDDYRCFTCGKEGEGSGMHAGHYINKALSQNLLFNEINVNAQCYRCNIHLGGNIDEYGHRLKIKYGEGIIEELRKLKEIDKQWTIQDLEELINKYNG